MPIRINTYQQAFDLIGIKLDDKAKAILKSLEQKGHTEKSISYVVWKSHVKLQTYKHDSRFWPIFINEVNKWSWAKNDPRWNDYWKRKNEIKKAETIRKQFARDDKLNSSIKTNKYCGYVYFVQGECGGPIKIGHSQNVAQRMKELQTGYPDILKLIGMIPGNVALETKIHQELEGYRTKGEWFKPLPPVLNRMKELLSNKK